MANPTEVYSVKFDVKSALEALGRLDAKLSAADRRARDLLQGRQGSEIDDALKRTSSRALKLRQQFEKAQSAIAAVTRNAAKETRKQTTDTKKLTDAGKSLDQMMRKFSRNASTGHKKVTRAIEGTARAVKKTDENLKKVPRSANRAAKGIRGVGTAGGIASQSLTRLIVKTSAFIGVLAGIRDVSREYGEFDQAATSAAAKFSRLEPALKPGTKAFADFKNEIRAATEGTEHSAAGAARAIDFWAKAGKTSAESKAVLQANLDFASSNQDAEGSMLDVARAGDILSDTLGQFRMPAREANELMASTSRVASVMTAAANRANMSAEELFESFKSAGPTLKLVGSDIEETSALLAAMADAGIKGASAGTQLKMSVANLSAMTGPQEAAMKKLGVSVKDADGDFRGLTTVIRDLNEATKEMGTADRAQVFAKAVGRRALPSFINLLAEGKTELDKTTQALKGAGGEHERLAETMRQSAQAQMSRFQNKLRGVGFEIIEKTKIIGHLTRAIDNIDWESVYQTIQTDVVPALKTAGKIISETVIPAFRRAYRLISSIFNPAIETAGWLFEKLGKSGQAAERVLGYLITAWVSYRAILLATKTVGILEWFAKLITSMGAATTAQGALNTQAAATNRTLGAQVKGFGRIKSAMAVLGAFAAGWAIGTVIHDELVEPLMKARHEAEMLQLEIEDTMTRDAKKRGSAQIKKDLENLYEREAQIKDRLVLSVRGELERKKELDVLYAEMKRLGAAIPAAQRREHVQRFALGYSGEAPPQRSMTPEFTDVEEWTASGGGGTLQIEEQLDKTAPVRVAQPIPGPAAAPVRPGPILPPGPDPGPAPYVTDWAAPAAGPDFAGLVKEQTDLSAAKAVADADYQKKSLEMMKKSEERSVTTNIEIGPTSVRVDAKGADAQEVGRIVESKLNKKAREDRAAIVAGVQTIAPAEI